MIRKGTFIVDGCGYTPVRDVGLTFVSSRHLHCRGDFDRGESAFHGIGRADRVSSHFVRTRSLFGRLNCRRRCPNWCGGGIWYAAWIGRYACATRSFVTRPQTHFVDRCGRRGSSSLFRALGSGRILRGVGVLPRLFLRHNLLCVCLRGSVAVADTRIINAPWLLAQINKLLSSTVEYDSLEIGAEGRAGDRVRVTLQPAFRGNFLNENCCAFVTIGVCETAPESHDRESNVPRKP